MPLIQYSLYHLSTFDKTWLLSALSRLSLFSGLKLPFALSPKFPLLASISYFSWVNLFIAPHTTESIPALWLKKKKKKNCSETNKVFPYPSCSNHICFRIGIVESSFNNKTGVRGVPTSWFHMTSGWKPGSHY